MDADSPDSALRPGGHVFHETGAAADVRPGPGGVVRDGHGLPWGAGPSAARRQPTHGVLPLHVRGRAAGRRLLRADRSADVQFRARVPVDPRRRVPGASGVHRRRLAAISARRDPAGRGGTVLLFCGWPSGLRGPERSRYCRSPCWCTLPWPRRSTPSTTVRFAWPWPSPRSFSAGSSMPTRMPTIASFASAVSSASTRSMTIRGGRCTRCITATSSTAISTWTRPPTGYPRATTAGRGRWDRCSKRCERSGR